MPTMIMASEKVKDVELTSDRIGHYFSRHYESRCGKISRTMMWKNK